MGLYHMHYLWHGDTLFHRLLGISTQLISSYFSCQHGLTSNIIFQLEIYGSHLILITTPTGCESGSSGYVPKLWSKLHRLGAYCSQREDLRPICCLHEWKSERTDARSTHGRHVWLWCYDHGPTTGQLNNDHDVTQSRLSGIEMGSFSFICFCFLSWLVLLSFKKLSTHIAMHFFSLSLPIPQSHFHL